MFDKLDTCALIIISVLVISLLSNNGFGGCIKNDGVVVNPPSNIPPPVQTTSSHDQVNSPPVHTQTQSLSSNNISGYSGGPEHAGYNGNTPKLDGYAIQSKLEQKKTIKSDDLKPKGKTQPWDSPGGDYIADVLNKVPFQQSQSLRNASLDIRSEVANPQVVVSPWMQSTISPDLQKRGVCA